LPQTSPGKRIYFFTLKGDKKMAPSSTIIRPAQQATPNLFEKYAGALPIFRSKREINAWVMSLRDEEAVDG
jgi:hypothetical protein